MSKITKFMKNPKSFFMDSLWFKKIELDIDDSYENIFVISHLGQLNQVEALIELENLKNNILIILYTNKNLRVPKSIQEQANKTLFYEIKLFLLPNSPNNYKLKSLVFMKNNYSNLLNILNPKSLYVLSFENHYSLLLNSAQNKKININLIDEGTATYKTKELSEYSNQVNIIKLFIARILKVEFAFDWFTKYDKIYAAFPELLKKTFYANSYNQFFAHAGKFNIDDTTSNLISKYQITSNDFLYVNQRYAINNSNFVKAILTILSKIGSHNNSKVFIKMHPKDHDNLKNEFKNRITDLCLSNNIIFIEENEFLIEPTIQIVQPKGVIGLTSTSLVYTPLVSPKTKVYSIKPWFVSLIPQKNNLKGIKIIDDHFEILKQFTHVIVLESKNDLNNDIVVNNSLVISNDKDELLKIAKESYNERKYQKSIVHYIWAYPSGIEDMPIDDFEKYLKAFNHKNGIKLSIDILKIWVEKELYEENELRDYISLINIVKNIINKNNEYSTTVFTNKIYDELLALITSKVGISTFSIMKNEVEIMLLDRYEKDLIALMHIKAKQYFINNKYEEALNIFEKILMNKEYVVNNEDIYISLMEVLIKLDKELEIIDLNSKIQNLDISNNIKIISESLLLEYKENNEESLELLLSINDELDIKEFKVELKIARQYRMLDDYEKAKRYLILFEKYSKGNILVHREIAYLEYRFENYAKAIAQFHKGYPSGIEDMPIDDFEKYLDNLNLECKYNKVYDLLNNKIMNEQFSYYYLISLFKLELYSQFIEFIEESRIDLKMNQDLIGLYISVLRREGYIKKAYCLILKYEVNINNIEYLIDIIEVCEISEDFEKAKFYTKYIITNFNNLISVDLWNKYYNILNILNK